MKTAPLALLALGLAAAPLVLSALPVSTAATLTPPERDGVVGLTEYGPSRSLLGGSMSGNGLTELQASAMRRRSGGGWIHAVRLRYVDGMAAGGIATLPRAQVEGLADFFERFDGGGEPRRNDAREMVLVSFDADGLRIERNIQPLEPWLLRDDRSAFRFETYQAASTLRTVLADLTALEAAEPAVDL